MFGAKNKQPNFKFELGDKAKDMITGFEGIIVYRTQWLHNCNVYGLKSQKLKDDKPMDNSQFDEPQLELVKEKVIEKSRKTGGPCELMKQTNR